MDGDSVVNKLLALDTGAKALARTEAPTEKVKTNAKNPDFIIIVILLPVTRTNVDIYAVIDMGWMLYLNTFCPN